jgi:hypothetical protein
VIVFAQDLARDAAFRILLKMGVKNRVCDEIANLIRMPFGNRLGGENEGAAHATPPISPDRRMLSRRSRASVRCLVPSDFRIRVLVIGVG